MRKIDIEMSCKVEIMQSFNLTDEEFSVLENGTNKEIYKILEPKIDFDCITEIKDLDIWTMEELEND